MTALCKICQSPAKPFAQAKVRGKYDAVFLRCGTCGFVSVQNPHWLGEAYAEPINKTDTGYVARNLGCREKIRLLIETKLDANAIFLDYAAGYGLFVRLMRDAGYDFRWFDPYCTNLFSRGFEAPSPLVGKYEAITAFEVFEHLTEPFKEIQEVSLHTDNIIFSTKIITNPPPQLEDWWYYGMSHGQHVSFYTAQSLEILAQKLGCHFVTDGGEFHWFARNPVSPNAMKLKRWQRLWQKWQPKRKRPSLGQPDHDAIEKRMLSEIT